MECKYCKKVLSTKSALNAHQKNTRYCLKIQGKDLSGKYNCEKCGKNFLNKNTYTYHQTTLCSNNTYYMELKKQLKTTEKQFLEMKEQIISLRKENELLRADKKDLQERYDKLSLTAVKRPTTSNTTNNTQNIINMKPLTHEYFRDNAELLTIEHIKKGHQGYAQFALDFCSNRLKVTDVNRKNVKFKSDTGGIVIDKGMLAFQKMLGSGINYKNQRLIEKYIHKEIEMREIAGINRIEIEQELLPLRQQLVYIAKMAKGDQTKLGQDICRIICQKLGAQGTKDLIREIEDRSVEELEELGLSEGEIEFVVESSNNSEDEEYAYSWKDGNFVVE
jgi:regulator of replication initiation timing